MTSCTDEEKAAVFSFPLGSAAGPDGLRPGHLRDLLGRRTAAAGERLLKELTEFVNLVLQGRTPPSLLSLSLVVA